jgi:hypothetical protein
MTSSQMGRKGYAALKKITTEAQRQAWREKGARATRRNFAAKRKLKKISQKA